MAGRGFSLTRIRDEIPPKHSWQAIKRPVLTLMNIVQDLAVQALAAETGSFNYVNNFRRIYIK